MHPVFSESVSSPCPEVTRALYGYRADRRHCFLYSAQGVLMNCRIYYDVFAASRKSGSQMLYDHLLLSFYGWMISIFDNWSDHRTETAPQ